MRWFTSRTSTTLRSQGTQWITLSSCKATTRRPMRSRYDSCFFISRFLRLSWTVVEALRASEPTPIEQCVNVSRGGATPLTETLGLMAALGWQVMDPYYNMSSYPVSSVADYLLYEVLPHNAVVPVAFPLMKQCDPAWGPDRIHVKTVCDVG